MGGWPLALIIVSAFLLIGWTFWLERQLPPDEE